nr:MAG TPA_asm: hypothetical protein [Caudoviricetes sp.]
MPPSCSLKRQVPPNLADFRSLSGVTWLPLLSGYDSFCVRVSLFVRSNPREQDNKTI